MNYNHPDLRRQLTDEYVMGTLQGAARRRFERLLQEDPALRDAVQQASLHWNLLIETLPPVQPSASVWQNIEQRITPQAVARTTPALLWEKKTGEESWSWLIRFWRGWAFAASAAAAVLALYIAVWAPAQRVTYVVVVTDDAEARASWLIGTGDDLQQLIVRALQPQPLPADRTFQLWMKVQDDDRVRPVGLIPRSGEAVLSLPPAIAGALDKAEKFGVSVEPQGGSPTGQPTTTPLYHGPVLRL
jgi:anti-sigma-K factor RskA